VIREQRLEALRAKLAASRAYGGGYEARVAAIEVEIRKLEAESE
jgi:hypothetical protein